jgi:hypothetical protein
MKVDNPATYRKTERWKFPIVRGWPQADPPKATSNLREFRKNPSFGKGGFLNVKEG